MRIIKFIKCLGIITMIILIEVIKNTDEYNI